MKKLSLLAIGFCLLGLTACQTVDGMVEDFKMLGVSEGPKPSASKAENFLIGDCPQAEVVRELASFNDFTDIAKPTAQSLVSRAQFGKIQSKCDYASQSVTVDLKLAFEGTIGPAGRMNNNDKPYFSYPFFVAVTSPNGAILAKEVFAASMTYQPGQDYQTYFESLRQIIPIPDKATGMKYKVLAGFQLSPEQLEYNRGVIRREEEAKKQQEKIAAESAKIAAEQNLAAPPVPTASVVIPPVNPEGPIVIAPAAGQ